MSMRPSDLLSSLCSRLTNFSVNPSAEILRYMRTKPNVLSLAQGEGSRPTPPEIVEAGLAAAKAGKTFYTPPLGIPELRQEIATYYSRTHGMTLPTNRVFVTPSGSSAMHYALTTLLEPEDEVICITPLWRNLLGAIELSGGQRVEVPMTLKDGKWTLDLDRVFGAVTSKTKAILILSPNNPTGWTATPAEIKALLEFTRERGLWIIADEVYGRLVYDGIKSPSFLDYADPEDRLYIVNSFSKAWAMTGWRLGWLIGPACTESLVHTVALYETMCPASFTQWAGIAALREGEGFIKENIDIWKKNRAYAYARLNAMPGVRALMPDAAFYMMLRHEKGSDCHAFAKRLIDEVSLGLSPGCGFGQAACGWLRLCFAVDPPVLEEALNRFERGIS